MNVECCRCGVVFETSGVTVKVCPSCSAAYRRMRGLVKPEGWVRKTADMAEYRRQHRAANPDKYREYEKRRPKRTLEENRRRYEAKMKKLHGPDYVVNDPANRLGHGGGKAAVLTDEERRLRHNTRRITRRAIKSGKLVPQPCKVCGCVDVEAHHPDYSKPIDVVWLCAEHHREIHRATIWLLE